MGYFHTALLLLLHIPVLTMDFFCFGRPGTCFVDWACLELRDLPVAFRVLELMCALLPPGHHGLF